MRAAYIEQTGPTEAIQVGELPRPEPGPGQVLVRVGADGAEPDRSVPAVGPGRDADVVPVHHRLRPGGDGRAGRPGCRAVPRRRPGLGVEPGVARPPGGRPPSTPRSTRNGSIRRPPRLSDLEAAALALVGITAHLGLFQFGRLKAGETVYVPGGSGGVGSMVVQMAKAIGTRVATTAGSPESSSSARHSAPTWRSITRPTTSRPAPRVRPRGDGRLVRDPARAQPRGRHPPAPQARAG